ncbi:MAG: carboxypeptidase regulatory-like domain-containing protein [Planctomycetota bacterium]|jgi:protocatechuate 3,4-dioxygenase beta subunit
MPTTIRSTLAACLGVLLLLGTAWAEEAPKPVWKGTVQGPGGTGIKGARVYVVKEYSMEWGPGANFGRLAGKIRLAPKVLGEMKTDEKGQFTLAVPPVKGPFCLRVSAEGFADTCIHWLSKDSLSHNLFVQLQRGFPMRGQVVDREGKPLDGADVVAIRLRGTWCGGENGRSTFDAFRARSGKDGLFEGPLVPRQHVLILVFREGFPFTYSQSAGFGDEPLEVVLDKSMSLSGKVLLGDEKKPVSGAELVAVAEGEYGAVYWSGYGRCVSGEDGVFRIENLAPGPYRLHVRSRGCMPVQVKFRGETGEKIDKEVNLRSVRPLGGRVIDAATKKPLAGVKVFISGSGFMAFGEGAVVCESGPDGGFALNTPPVGPLRDIRVMMMGLDRRSAWLGGLVKAAKPGWALQEPEKRKHWQVRGARWFLTKVEEEKDWNLELVMNPQPRMSGQVVDGEGKPVTGAIVKVLVEKSIRRDHGHSVGLPAATCRTDSEGKFGCFLECGNEVSLLIWHPDFAPETFSFDSLSPGKKVENVRIVLRKGALLEGSAMDGKGKPVQNGRIYLQYFGRTAKDGGRPFPMLVPLPLPQSYPVDEKGRFSIPHVMEGPWLLCLYSTNHPSVRQKVTVEADKTQKIDVTVSDSFAISGVVVDKEGKPIWNVMVSAQQRRGSGGTTRTRRDGSFTIRRLPAGAYHVGLQSKTYFGRLEKPCEAGTADVKIVVSKLK